jgi:DNA repair protein RadA/Sms
MAADTAAAGRVSPRGYGAAMAKSRTILACGSCRQQVSQWVGRCPGCGAWGTIAASAGRASPATVLTLAEAPASVDRVSTGLSGLDRVLGGGLVPASVILLAGEPGIGKSTLLLHLLANLSGEGKECLLASGEESHGQVAARARRLGVSGDAVAFVPGRDLPDVLAIARERRPFLLAVDSIQSLRDPEAAQMPGGVAQVRTCTDALVGLAKELDISVVMTGHVTKDGLLAGPRALEHAVDVVLLFEGDPRSGQRALAGGKNRFGAEGESSWFEMSAGGLREIDAAGILRPGERVAGAALALPMAGRRAIAVEIQALVGSTDGPPRRQSTGLDPKRFQLLAAVLDRAGGFSAGRAELFGATSGGMRVDDPAADLAILAALASALSGRPVPPGTAFLGEVSLTGVVRPPSGLPQRLAAAETAGCDLIVAGASRGTRADPRIMPVRHVAEALAWASGAGTSSKRAAS